MTHMKKDSLKKNHQKFTKKEPDKEKSFDKKFETGKTIIPTQQSFKTEEQQEKIAPQEIGTNPKTPDTTHRRNKPDSRKKALVFGGSLFLLLGAVFVLFYPATVFTIQEKKTPPHIFNEPAEIHTPTVFHNSVVLKESDEGQTEKMTSIRNDNAVSLTDEKETSEEDKKVTERIEETQNDTSLLSTEKEETTEIDQFSFADPLPEKPYQKKRTETSIDNGEQTLSASTKTDVKKSEETAAALSNSAETPVTDISVIPQATDKSEMPTEENRAASFKSTQMMKTIFDLKQSVLQLEKKMDTLANFHKKEAESLFALLLLKEKINQGSVYGEELSLFAELNQDNPIAEGLVKILSDSKPLTYHQLLKSYKKAYEKAYADSFVNKDDGSFMRHLKIMFFSAFKIRQMSVNENDMTIRGRLNKAYLLLEKKQITEALDVLRGIENPPEEFIHQAETYLIVQTYLDTLIKNAFLTLSKEGEIK